MMGAAVVSCQEKQPGAPVRECARGIVPAGRNDGSGVPPPPWGCVCGKSLPRQGFREACLGLWHPSEKKPFGLGLLAPGAGDQGSYGAFRSAVARTMGGAMVLAAEGDGPAWFAALVEEEAGARIESVRVVAGTEGLAGARSTGAALTPVDGGAEAWHDGPPEMERVAGGRPFSW